MKLTIRTLLAWLDGVLPPEEQRQLSAKVSDNQLASGLVERIQRSIAMPMVGAPAPSGRGLADDPNSAAEFLDNTMSVDQLKHYELICYESDKHLAEVAACHRMLAEIAGDPNLQSVLDQPSRQRLKALVRQRLEQRPFGVGGIAPVADGQGDGLQESRETARALRAVLASATDNPGGVRVGGSADAAAYEQTDRPRAIHDRTSVPAGPAAPKSSRAAWMSAAIALTLLTLLGGVLAWSVFGKSGRREPAPQQRVAAGTPSQTSEAVAPAAAAVDAVAASDGSQPVDAAPPMNAVAAATPTREPAAEAEPADGGVAEPPTAAKPAAAPTEALAAASVPAGGAKMESTPRSAASQGPANQGPLPPAVPVPPAAAASPAVPAPPAAGGRPAATAAKFEVADGTVLRWEESGGVGQWQLAAAGAQLRSGDELLVPPWCEATLAFGGIDVRLLSCTNVVVSGDRNREPLIEVLCGRTVIVGQAQAGSFSVRAAGVAGSIATNPLTKIAIVVPPEHGGGGCVPGESAQFRGQAIAVRQPFAWQPNAADGSAMPGSQPLQVAADSALAYEDGHAAVAAGVPPPAWADAAEPVDRNKLRAIEELADKLGPPKDGAPPRPTLLRLRELATTGKRDEYRMIAAATLAMLGDSDELVGMLTASALGTRLENRQWLELEAMAVPAVLARGGEAAAGLRKAFDKQELGDKAELIWTMTQCISDAALANGMDRELVDALDDPNMIVRRYAFKTLRDITQVSKTDELRYRPDMPAKDRRDGVAWWRGQLERGLVRRPPGAPPN